MINKDKFLTLGLMWIEVFMRSIIVTVTLGIISTYYKIDMPIFLGLLGLTWMVIPVINVYRYNEKKEMKKNGKNIKRTA